MTCPAGSDSCGKIHYSGKVKDVPLEGFVKACAVKSACNKDLCKATGQAGIDIDDCTVDCCEGDLCNGAKVPMVSAFLLLACALLAFFR